MNPEDAGPTTGSDGSTIFPTRSEIATARVHLPRPHVQDAPKSPVSAKMRGQLQRLILLPFEFASTHLQ